MNWRQGGNDKAGGEEENEACKRGKWKEERENKEAMRQGCMNG